jgi:hypothetical protein
MGTTTKGIVYPSTPSAQADLITDLQTMAETTDTAIGNVQIPVDSALSPTSTNPVQNKVIYATIGNLETILETLDVRKWGVIDEYSNKNPSNV